MTNIFGGYFAAVPLKRATATSFAEPLRAYITSAYAEPPDSYRDDLRVLDALRGACVQPVAQSAAAEQLA
ncbi:hypothetical protein THASP1DRAFT_32813, partial [Thamnocephalis sphaerospora]